MSQSIFRGAIPLVAANGSSQVATAVALGLAARDGTPSSFAILAGGVSIVTITSNLIDFGNNTWAVRETAAGRLGAEDFVSTVRTKLALAIALGIAAVGTISLVSAPVPLTVSAGLACLLVTRVTTMSYFARLVGQGSFQRSGGLLAVDRFAGLAVLLLARSLGVSSTLALPVALALGGAVSIAFSQARWFAPPERLRAGRMTRPTTIWRRSRSFGAQSVATDAQQLDVWVVTLTASPYVAGLIALASRLVSPAAMLGAALANVTLSRYADRERAAHGAGDAVLMGLVVLGLGTGAGSAFYWLPRLFGRDFDGAVYPFAVYCGSAVFVIMGQLVASRLQAAGLEARVASIVSTGSLVALLLLGVGGHFAGAVGASCGILAANVSMFVALAWLARRVRRHEPHHDSPSPGL